MPRAVSYKMIAPATPPEAAQMITASDGGMNSAVAKTPSGAEAEDLAR